MISPRSDPAPIPGGSPASVASLWDRFLVGLAALSGILLLGWAFSRLASGFDPAGVMALLSGLGYFVVIGLTRRQKNWALPLARFLAIVVSVTCFLALGELLFQVDATYQAGQALSPLGVGSRLLTILLLLTLQLAILLRLPKQRRVNKTRLALTYIGPTLLAVVVFNVYPILYNIGISFTNRNLFRFKPCPEGLLGFSVCPSKGFVVIGLPNYQKLLGSLNSDFLVVIARSALWTAVCVVLFFGVGLGLALLLNNARVAGRSVYRTLLIIPWAIPFYISALIWKFFFNGEFGTLNILLRSIGWANPPAWLNQPGTAFWAVVVINVWMSYPFFMTLILGALQSIPLELYEAAQVDGANAWFRLWRITLPLIRPAVLPGVVLSALTTFKLFDTVWMVTSGGPFTGASTGATEIVMVYAYRQAFQLFNYGYISAFAVLVFVLLFIATLFNLRILGITRSIYR